LNRTVFGAEDLHPASDAKHSRRIVRVYAQRHQGGFGLYTVVDAPSVFVNALMAVAWEST
jgi:hypothetical protein